MFPPGLPSMDIQTTHRLRLRQASAQWKRDTAFLSSTYQNPALSKDRLWMLARPHKCPQDAPRMPPRTTQARVLRSGGDRLLGAHCATLSDPAFSGPSRQLCTNEAGNKLDREPPPHFLSPGAASRGEVESSLRGRLYHCSLWQHPP